MQFYIKLNVSEVRPAVWRRAHCYRRGKSEVRFSCPIKSNTVSHTARYRCDVSVAYYPGAMPRIWATVRHSLRPSS